MEVFKYYIKIKGGGDFDSKRAIVKWTDPNEGVDFQIAKNQYSSYAGVLRDDIVCLDVDTKQDDPSIGLKTFEIINKYIKDNKIKCRIMKTNNGWHFYFKKPESEKDIRRHCPAILCCGLKVDYLVSPSYCVVKLNGESRKILQDFKDLDELPKPLCIAVSNQESISKYNFYNAGHGERYTAISGFKLVLLKKGYSQEDLNECISMCCDLFAEKYTKAKIQEICNIKPKELDKIEIPAEKRNEKEDKSRLLKETETWDFADELIEKYSITLIDKNFKNTYYKETEESIYKPIALYGDFDQLPRLCALNTDKQISHSRFESIRDRIRARGYLKTLEDFNKFIATKDDQIIDLNTLEKTNDKDVIMRVRLNCNYNPQAYSEVVDEAIDNFCHHDKKLRMEFEEIIGQCVLPYNEVKKLSILVGEPNSGKTTMMNMVKNMIGLENVSSMNLEDIIKQEFFASGLNGKTANIGDEITGTDKLSIDRLKALTGDSDITVNRKNKDPFSMRNGAYLVFLCNALPKFKKIDAALEDRLHLITIPTNNFPKNKKFIDKVSTEEAKSYLLNLALKGIQRVRDNGYEFTTSINSTQTKNRYIGTSDVLKRFLGNLYLQNCDIYNKNFTIDYFYKLFCDYFEYCYGKNTEPWASREFSEKLRRELSCEKGRASKVDGEKQGYFLKRSFSSKELQDFEKYADENLEKSFEELQVEDLQKELDEIGEEKPKTEIKEVKKNTRDLIIFDFEIFKEDWVFGYKKISRLNSDQSYYSICNDRAKLVKFYNENKEALWVGYNSNNYDANILKAIIKGINPKEVSDYIIVNKDKSKLSIYKKFDFKGFCQDLITFDCCQKNGATIIGLKELEAYMGDSIEESSVDFNINRKLTDAELEEVMKYNKHDVEETLKVFRNNIEDYQARRDLIKKYKLDFKCINKTKSQLSTIILGCQRPEQSRGDAEEIEFIPTLKIEKNKDVLDFYRNGDWRPIKEGDKEKNPQFIKLINGVPHCFGVGGLHGAIGTINDGVDKATPVHRNGHLLHIDVQSYYPSLMIKYNWLSRNCQKPELYKQIYEERLKLKAEGKKAEQAPLKIVLNATYGIMKDKRSDAYDPRQANNICINGQLALLDLLEKLEGHCDLIQTNTDGIIVQLKTMKDLSKIREIVKEWEDRIGVTTSFDYLTEIWQRDVNCYLIKFETEKGKKSKVECKGKELTFNDSSNNNINVVKEAVRQFMLNGTAVEETINDSKFKLIDFQMLTKYGSTYDYVCYGNEKLETKYNRVFASSDKNDPCLYKVKNKKVKEAKKLDDQFGEMKDNKPKGAEKIANCPLNCFIDNGDINNKELPKKLDKKWYIKEAKRLLYRMTGGQHGEGEESVK